VRSFGPLPPALFFLFGGVPMRDARHTLAIQRASATCTQQKKTSSTHTPPHLPTMSDKLLDQIFNLKFTSKQMVRQSVRAEKEEKEEKLKVRR
jgi:hypothetical protein